MTFLEELYLKIQEIEADPLMTPPEKAALLKQARRTLCRKDLYYLIHNVLGYRDTTNWHRRLSNSIVANRDIWQLHLHPRGHFKSTVITIGESIQDLLIDPNDTNLIVNAILGKAKAFLREIKSHFQKNEVLLSLFPEYRIEHKTQMGTGESWTCPARTNHWIREGSIEVTGVDQAVVSAHYAKLTLDDIVNNLNVGTAALRAKLKARFSEYLSLLNPPGRVRIVGTRWHYYDLYGWLLERLQKEDEVDFDFKIFKSAALVDGMPIFPERFTHDYLNKLRGSQGQYIFSCQYLNDPQPNEDKTFDYRQVSIVKTPKVPNGTHLFKFTTCDPSVSQTKRSDPTVISTVAVNCDGEFFITRIRRGWWNPDEIIENLLQVVKLDSPQRCGIETTAFQRVLKYYLDKESKRRKIFFRVEEIKRSTAVHKEDRIKAIQPYLNAGLINIVDDVDNPSEETLEFMEELDTFPFGKFDDILDTIADCIQIHRTPSKAQQRKVEFTYAESSSPFRTGYRFRIRPTR
jgi:predicted phage terminase large subunit-like protein